MKHVFVVLPGSPPRLLELDSGIIYPAKIKRVNRELGDILHKTETNYTYILYLEPEKDYTVKAIRRLMWFKPVYTAILEGTTVGKISKKIVPLTRYPNTFYRLYVNKISYMEKAKARKVKKMIETMLRDTLIQVDPPRHIAQLMTTIKWTIAYVKELFYISSKTIKRFTIKEAYLENTYIARKIIVNTRRVLALA